MRNCIDCGDVIVGRSDKKFCSGHCRSSFYHDKFRSDSPITRTIVTRLHRNRRILLDTFIKQKSTSISELTVAGFNFKYSTHQECTIESVVYYCFDVGYCILNEEIVVIIKPTVQ